MKRTLILLATLFTISASAQVNPADLPTQFPTDSEWAIHKVSSFCKVSFTAPVVGSIESKNNITLFKVSHNGKLVAMVTKKKAPLGLGKQECYLYQ